MLHHSSRHHPGSLWDIILVPCETSSWFLVRHHPGSLWDIILVSLWDIILVPCETSSCFLVRRHPGSLWDIILVPFKTSNSLKPFVDYRRGMRLALTPSNFSLPSIFVAFFNAVALGFSSTALNVWNSSLNIFCFSIDCIILSILQIQWPLVMKLYDPY